MVQTPNLVLVEQLVEANNLSSVPRSHVNLSMTPTFAVDEEIPTVDYSILFCDDLDRRFKAREWLSKACDDYGFFYLVNHGVPDEVIEAALKGIADFFELTTEEEKKKYKKCKATDRIMYELNSHAGENREYLKLVTHPQFHCPSTPLGFSEALEEYFRRFNEVKIGLARAISAILGFEENYIEKEFKLKFGFDVAALILYPPNFKSKGAVGFPSHTDVGFIISLIQDVDGGLQILSHSGKWINVYIPRNAFLIQLGDHLEILTNGKYKSHIHRVMVDNNKVRRISLATVHGPSLNAFVRPAPEFVDKHHPVAYRGMIYKESLEANGHDVIDSQSPLEHVRL